MMPAYKLFGRFNVNLVENPERLATYIRNYSCNIFRYNGMLPWLSFLGKQLAYEVVVRRSLRRSWIVLNSGFVGVSSFRRTVDRNVKETYRPDLSVSADLGKVAKQIRMSAER